MSVETSLRLRTHGKVNLFLRVLGRRLDGFHEVETILQVIDLYDELVVSPRAEAGIEVEMKFAPGLTGELPSANDNLISRSAQRLITRRDPGSGVRIDVVKGIPIGAGLGGGSGNAAGTLVVLSELWEQEIPRAELLEIAGELGSDVPYCIDGGTALATARGEKLTQLAGPDEMWFVLGGSQPGLSSRAVYERWDELAAERNRPSSAPMTLALGASDIAEVGSLLHNDLEPPAFSMRPELEAKKQALIDAGVLGAVMTGSGPTLLGLARDEEHARAVAAVVEDRFDWIRVVRSRPDCIERL